MAQRRSDIVSYVEEGVYHCSNTCIAQDPLLDIASNMGCRYACLYARCKFLCEVFSLQLLAISSSAHRFDLIVRMQPQNTVTFSNEEVVRRFRRMFGVGEENELDGSREVLEEQVLEDLKNIEKINKWRGHLGDLGWFMARLSEFVAVKANHADARKGHFWSAPYKCTALKGYAAISASLQNVDSVSARFTEHGEIYYRPHSSAYDRHAALKAGQEVSALQQTGIDEESEALLRAKHKASCARWLGTTTESDDHGFGFPEPGTKEYFHLLLRVSISVASNLLDPYGALAKSRYRSALDDVHSDELYQLVAQTAKTVGRMLGDVHEIQQCAFAAGKKWFKGIAVSRKLFGPAPPKRKNPG